VYLGGTYASKTHGNGTDNPRYIIRIVIILNKIQQYRDNNEREMILHFDGISSTSTRSYKVTDTDSGDGF